VFSGNTETDSSVELTTVAKLRELDSANGSATITPLESVDSGIVAEAEKIGSLPPEYDIWADLGDIGLAAGTFEVGWRIGSSLRELFGLEGKAEEALVEEVWRHVCEKEAEKCGAERTLGGK
jgi:hypothetical protein